MALPIYLGHYVDDSVQEKHPANSKYGQTFAKHRNNRTCQKYIQCCLARGGIADFTYQIIIQRNIYSQKG